MRREHKLNGFPYESFADIGIPVARLYYFANKKLSEKEILNKAFILKYGKPLFDRNHQFKMYYKHQVSKINNSCTEKRVKRLKLVKNDLYESGKFFGIKERTLDTIWNDVSLLYLSVN